MRHDRKLTSRYFSRSSTTKISANGDELMGFNYATLDSFEFETLARDVVEKFSGVKLSCFTAGRDGGIDAADYYYHKGLPCRVVVQAKRWTGRVDKNRWLKTAEALVAQLKHDGNVPTKSLYIVTSQGLSRDVQRAVIDCAETQGICSCIMLDSIRLDELLSLPEYLPILRKHFKLWVAGTNVLQMMRDRSVDIDTDVFLQEIEEHRDLYIQTSIFDEAIDLLRRNPVLLITGNPGTGKTILTQMIALHLSVADYENHYSSCNSLNLLKNVSSADDDSKELFVLDDFLGQRNLDAEMDQIRELVTFLRYISRSKRRRVVLNSRISIFNEAKFRDDSFSQFIKCISSCIVTIDTSTMTLVDKGRIFISNLMFEKVPVEYVSSLTVRNNRVFDKSMKLQPPNY